MGDKIKGAVAAVVLSVIAAVATYFGVPVKCEVVDPPPAVEVPK